MGEVVTIGLDIAKLVFQVHGVDDAGTIMMRKRVSRSMMLEFFRDLPPCLFGIEACPAADHCDLCHARPTACGGTRGRRRSFLCHSAHSDC
jgi:hypothetical protein